MAEDQRVVGGHLLSDDALVLGYSCQLDANRLCGVMSHVAPAPLTKLTAAQTQLVDELRETGADFHRRGWSLGTSSNYSVVTGREPLELLVTVSGRDKGRLSRDDFVSVGANGKPLDADGPKSSAETMLHVVLAGELSEVGSVLHTHSVWGTLLSDHCHQAGELVISGYEMLKGLDGIGTHESSARIPIFDNTQDIPAMAEQVRAWLASKSEPPHAFLIHKHGLYTWGKDLAAARRQIEVLEFLFECEGRKRMATVHIDF